MISTIFIILSVLWILLALYLAYLFLTDCEPEPIIGTIIILGIVGFLNAMPIVHHIKDVSLIRNQELVISVKEEAIQRINDDLKDLKAPSAALMNADSPVKTLIETKSQYISDLTDLKTEIAEAKINIERRKMGPSAWVVWAIGE